MSLPLRTIRALTTILGMVHTASAFACSCAPLTFEQAVAHLSVVFEGRVIAAETNESEYSLVARVSVARRIKGGVDETASVVTSSASSMCGYPLVAGDVLTFGGDFDSRGRLTTNMCVMVPLNPRPHR